MKKYTPSQLKSKLRQIERQRNQIINKYNREARKLNNDLKRSISNYNAAVRRYNSRVRQNRQIINREINKLRTSNITTYVRYSSSITAMHTYYTNVNTVYNEDSNVTAEQNHILDLIEQEHANSLITANSIIYNDIPFENTEDIEIGEKLEEVSIDLNNRWKGAVYALNPSNPDAARHFCTSTREIFTEFIEMKAPDDMVFAYKPDCERTNRGNATRREKIKYLMRNIDVDDSIVDFADEDITNILELFHILSDGTHGAAGRYEFNQLLQVKKRVEQGINFLCEISS